VVHYIIPYFHKPYKKGYVCYRFAQHPYESLYDSIGVALLNKPYESLYDSIGVALLNKPYKKGYVCYRFAQHPYESLYDAEGESKKYCQNILF
jgi:hypothetical protein